MSKKLTNGYLDQLKQLVTATWDGDVACKDHRDRLFKAGLITRVNGWNVISRRGMALLIHVGVLRPY